MELRHLKTFLAAAETLSISAASRQLRVTQPALSRQIQDLEAEIGQPLFVRHPKGLRLTAAGEELRARGAKIVVALDETLRAVRGDEKSGPPLLRVGYYATMDTWAKILAPAMDKLARRVPGLSYAVTDRSCGELLGDLREGRIDVALLGPGEYPRLSGIAISVASSFPAAVLAPINHRLAKKRQLALEELRDEEIVTLTEDSAPGRDRAFVDACRAAGFVPKLLPIGRNIPEAITAGIQRQALGIAGNFAMTAPHPGVVFIKLKPPGVRLELHVAHAETVPHAQPLAELIAAEARRVIERL